MNREDLDVPELPASSTVPQVASLLALDQSEEYRVRYKDNAAICLTVTLINTWRRGEIIPAQSISSGLKFYVKNLIWSAFESAPQADAISMVRGKGPPFLLLRAGRRYFDVKGKEVEVSPIRNDPKAGSPA